MSLLAAAGVAKGIGAAFGFGSKRKQSKQTSALAKQQTQMAYENNQLELQELGESIRRTELNNTLTRGSAKSKAAASGVTLSGTTQGYLNFMEDTQSDQVDWMRTAGESRAAQNLESNLLSAKATKYDAQAQKRGAFTGLIGDTASIFGMFAK